MTKKDVDNNNYYLCGDGGLLEMLVGTLRNHNGNANKNVA